MSRVGFLLILALLLPLACREKITEVDPNRSPQIMNLQIVPAVVCTGVHADVSFEVLDPNGDAVEWSAKLNTLTHGDLQQRSGTGASGSTVHIDFKAAKTGFHNHRVTLTVTAHDASGADAAPVELIFSVLSIC